MFKLTFNDAVIFTMQTMIDEINTQLIGGKLTDDERKALSKTRQDCAKTIERTLDAKAKAAKCLLFAMLFVSPALAEGPPENAFRASPYESSPAYGHRDTPVEKAIADQVLESLVRDNVTAPPPYYAPQPYYAPPSNNDWQRQAVIEGIENAIVQQKKENLLQRYGR